MVNVHDTIALVEKHIQGTGRAKEMIEKTLDEGGVVSYGDGFNLNGKVSIQRRAAPVEAKFLSPRSFCVVSPACPGLRWLLSGRGAT